MYKYIIFLILNLILIVLLSGQIVYGQTTEIVYNPSIASWDAVSDFDLAGYGIYYGEAGGPYTLIEKFTLDSLSDINNPNYSMVGITIPEGQWVAVVTAYDLVGNESGYSNEAPFGIDHTPPGIPSNFNSSGGVIIIINIGQ
jgi:hypothetical protein